MSDLVGAPSRVEFEEGPTGIGHQLTQAEIASILAFVRRHEKGYPLLYRIVRFQYEPEGEFELNREGQDALSNEVSRLVERVVRLRDSSRAAALLRRFETRVRNTNPMYSLRGLSVEAALAGLREIQEFIEEVQKRGWLLFGAVA